MSSFPKTPEPPYYAVIFFLLRTPGDNGYDAMAERMAELASQQPGFLGAESARGDDGFGITVSYWSSAEAIARWKANIEHVAAQEMGKAAWYAHYEPASGQGRVCLWQNCVLTWQVCVLPLDDRSGVVGGSEYNAVS